MGLQVQNAKLGIVYSKALQEDETEVHHEERQVGGIGHCGLFDIHKIIQAPILLGVTEVGLGIAATLACSHHKFTGDAGKDCAAFRVGRAFLAFDGGPFGMTGHLELLALTHKSVENFSIGLLIIL
jgi:hypothetical protein